MDSHGLLRVWMLHKALVGQSNLNALAALPNDPILTCVKVLSVCRSVSLFCLSFSQSAFICLCLSFLPGLGLFIWAICKFIWCLCVAVVGLLWWVASDGRAPGPQRCPGHVRSFRAQRQRSGRRVFPRQRTARLSRLLVA